MAGRDLSDGVPLTELDRESFIVREDSDGDRPFASPRTDLITKFISTKKGRGLLTLSSGAVGAALGTFVGKVCVFTLNLYSDLYGFLLVSHS